MTSRYINRTYKNLIDDLFKNDPLVAWARKEREERDEFDEWVRETRAEAGIIDPPREKNTVRCRE